jgi:hypothetical protein
MNTISQKEIEDLSERCGVSTEAVRVLAQAVRSGNGTMAQFNHPELGGPGQWSHGGMTMIGDMFNDALKTKVKQLCSDLANLLGGEASAEEAGSTSRPARSESSEADPSESSLVVPAPETAANHWWRADLGSPSSTGAQNHIRYAYFPASGRLAINIAGDVTVYDTADHEIGGVSQQQSGDSTLTFTSQNGLVRVDDLRVVSRTA